METKQINDTELNKMFSGKTIKYNGLYELKDGETGIGLLVNGKLIMLRVEEIERGDK